MDANLKEKLPQEGTGGTADGESLPEHGSGCPTYSGGGEALQKMDSAGVGDQASEAVNATGKRKLIQQAFHPSLFINRPRSSSVGSSSKPNTPALQRPYMEEDNKLVESNGKPKSPPEWQRVPSSNNSKKRKIRHTPSPEKLETSNRFSGLTVDLTGNDEEVKTKKPSKPPPIVLYGVEDVSKLTNLLQTVTEREKFSYKIVNRNQMRVSCTEIEVYRKLISLVREKGLIGHTFTPKDQRNYRIVIRNLHHSTPLDEITEAIEGTGNLVTGEIINVKHGPEKKPTSTFFVNLVPGTNNKAVKELKYIYHQSVTVEDPKRKKSIVQCQRCQQYGHSKNYCMRPPRCVKCAQSHKTSECSKRDRNTPAKCTLCQGPHPANYKGCEVYREILARKNTTTKIRPKRGYLNPPRQEIEQSDYKLTTDTARRDNNKKDSRQSNGKKIEHIENCLYSEALKNAGKKLESQQSNLIEKIFINQAEKLDQILQQMSTLMQLITSLVNKLTQ